MRKQKICFLLIFVMIFSLLLVGCKKNVGTYEDNAVKKDETEEVKKDKDNSDESTVEEKKIKIGFSVIDMENPYFLTLKDALVAALDQTELEYELITKDPGTDAELQGEQILELIDEEIDYMVLCPVDWERISPSLLALENAGVPIINLDTQVKDMEYVDAFIGSNNYQAGVLCGEDLIERCPEGGEVAILESPSMNSVNDRISGFEETIANAENGFEVVARVDTKGSFEIALDKVADILKEHPDLVAIMCGNDQLAVAAQTQLNLAEMPDTWIYGVDGSPDIKKELGKPKNQIAGTVSQSLIEMGSYTAQTIIAMENEEDYEKEIYLEVFMINDDNVDLYGVDGWQ